MSKGTPTRNFRIADALYRTALAAAHERGENLTEHVVVPALVAYIESKPGNIPSTAAETAPDPLKRSITSSPSR